MASDDAHALSANADDDGRPAALDDGWPIAAPESQGMDAALLRGIGPRFAAWKEARAHAVLVARHGSLVYERYFAGEDWRRFERLDHVAYAPDVRHDIRSITKSVTSLLVGAAIARGWIEHVDAPVLSFFPEHAARPGQERITLAHLLTMSPGLLWEENWPWESPLNNERGMDEAADPVAYTLAQPVVAPPGQFYNYGGYAATLLQEILKRRSGKRLEVLAQEILFAPLGITDLEWMRFASGEARGYGGLRLRARDLAKLGQMLLNRGTWQGRAVIPADWIEQSTTPHITGEGIFFYGYQWWLGRSLLGRREINWFAGFGNGGQRLYVVPALDVVVVIFGGAYGNLAPVGDVVLKRHVLPAICAQGAPPPLGHQR
jgi:CubicO group peptidase (beta-lactamase class C family)